MWQCGSYYYEDLKKQLDGKLPENVKLLAFLKRMDLAYAAADIVVAVPERGQYPNFAYWKKRRY